RVVGLDDNNELSFGLSVTTNPEFLSSRLEDKSTGDLVEYSPQAEMIAGEIGRRICRGDGVAMIVDYGSWRSLGDTLQALRHHKPVGPLESPGDADVTAHVNFEAIAAAAAPARHSELTPQGVFLERLGIAARAQALARGLTEKSLESHIAAHRRLTHPDEMGNLFKVMALYAPDTPVPPGLGA
ncbi:MAG: SAM-dependent methyltransferase, partial [Boseongicola sp.]